MVGTNDVRLPASTGAADTSEVAAGIVIRYTNVAVTMPC